MSIRRRGGMLLALSFEAMRAHGVADGQPQVMALAVVLRRSLRTRQIFSRPPPMQHRRDHVLSRFWFDRGSTSAAGRALRTWVDTTAAQKLPRFRTMTAADLQGRECSEVFERQP